MDITYLDHKTIKIICEELNELLQDYKRQLKEFPDDPPPIYKQTSLHVLDSIISIPQKTFDGQELYPTVFEKAACYFYFINKLHPFNNGNKRMSIIATGVFLLLNNYDYTAEMEKMYVFAKNLTVSHRDQETEFKEVVEFISKCSKKLSPDEIK